MTDARKTPLLATLLLAVATFAAGCSKSGHQEQAAAGPAATPAAATPVAAPSTAIPAPPQLQARAYILIDADSGRVLAAFQPDTRQEPASLTKLMAAYADFAALRQGRMKLDDMVTISEHAWKQEGSRMFVQVGTQVSVQNLIQGMITQSGNDATVALAEKVAGTEATFVQLMNGYAKQLGMTGTHFMDSSGLPNPQHYTTARDIATLTAALIREFPDYYHWYSEKEFTWNGITQQNRNGLLWKDPTVDGVKTGHTETAGYCLVASAKRNGMRLISVVLGMDSMKAREDASAALLNYGFSFYETKRLYAAGQPLTTVHVWKGAVPEVGLAMRRDLFVTTPRGQASSVKAEFDLPAAVVAPLSARTPLGKARIVVDGATIATYDLYPAQDVARGGLFRRAWDSLRLIFH